jgi:integrase
MYITPRGVKSFFVRKRVNGKDRRIIIGNYPETDIEMAREKVNEVLDNASKPIPMRRKQISFRDFVDVYISNKVRRSEDSLIKLKRAINLHFCDLFKQNVSEITTKDVQKILDNINGRAMALRMQELLQSIFNYAIDMGYRKDNPMETIERINVTRRVRKLNKTGINKLLIAIKKEENINLQSAFLMLIYGFAPKTKIFKMRWDDLDFNHDLWGDAPLSDMAILLLRDLPQDGEWVFMGRGRFHLTDPRIAWKRIVKNAGIPNVTMDDVYKFLMHALVWNPDKDALRENMNDVLSDLFD